MKITLPSICDNLLDVEHDPVSDEYVVRYEPGVMRLWNIQVTNYELPDEAMVRYKKSPNPFCDIPDDVRDELERLELPTESELSEKYDHFKAAFMHKLSENVVDISLHDCEKDNLSGAEIYALAEVENNRLDPFKGVNKDATQSYLDAFGDPGEDYMSRNAYLFNKINECPNCKTAYLASMHGKVANVNPDRFWENTLNFIEPKEDLSEKYSGLISMIGKSLSRQFGNKRHDMIQRYGAEILHFHEAFENKDKLMPYAEFVQQYIYDNIEKLEPELVLGLEAEIRKELTTICEYR